MTVMMRRHAKKKGESENGTYEYSSSISTSMKTMIRNLKMF